MCVNSSSALPPCVRASPERRQPALPALPPQLEAEGSQAPACLPACSKVAASPSISACSNALRVCSISCLKHALEALPSGRFQGGDPTLDWVERQPAKSQADSIRVPPGLQVAANGPSWFASGDVWGECHA